MYSHPMCGTILAVKNHLEKRRDLAVDMERKSSNKTLLGISDQAHLQGIEVEINRARNVIIRDMKISHVTPADAIVITGKSQNIWIDHCELFSDRDHGMDYYDGLLDIKNESSFITISWCVFHDHFKTSLISSGDESTADSTIRVTFHHNFFYNCDARLPSIRFGKAHVFNNYYKDCRTAINSRMGACVRVERNYFYNVSSAVMMDYSPEKGGVQLIDNYFGESSYASEPACVLEVPYSYEEALDETNDLPLMLAGEAIAAVAGRSKRPHLFSLSTYPNPFNASTNIRLTIPKTTQVKLTIWNLLGQQIDVLLDQRIEPGQYTLGWDSSGHCSGIYLLRLQTDQFAEIRKMTFLK